MYFIKNNDPTRCPLFFGYYFGRQLFNYGPLFAGYQGPDSVENIENGLDFRTVASVESSFWAALAVNY